MKYILYIMCWLMFVSTSIAMSSDSSGKDVERAIYFCYRDAEFSPDIFLKEKRDKEDDLSNDEVMNISTSLARLGQHITQDTVFS